jgi:phasin family protein
MNKTRFQLPPRAGSADGVDHWVIGDARLGQSDAKVAFGSDNSAEMPPPLRFPFAFDMVGLLAAQRRTMEAITISSRILREAAQAVAQRNLEALQQAINGFADHVQTMGNPECRADQAMRQTETAIKAYEDATAYVRELGQTIQHANSEAMEVLNRRFTEAVDEVKLRARHATGTFWDTKAKPVSF